MSLVLLFFHNGSKRVNVDRPQSTYILICNTVSFLNLLHKQGSIGYYFSIFVFFLFSKCTCDIRALCQSSTKALNGCNGDRFKSIHALSRIIELICGKLIKLLGFPEYNVISAIVSIQQAATFSILFFICVEWIRITFASIYSVAMQLSSCGLFHFHWMIRVTSFQLLQSKTLSLLLALNL